LAEREGAASEFERGVRDSVHTVLKDQSALATTLHDSGVPPAEIQSILRTLQALDISGQSDRSETTNLAPVVRRVDLRKDGIELSVDLESIVPRGADSPPLTITRFIPLRIGRRGVAMRLVFGGGVSARKPDPSLLKAVARGYRWFHEVISDQGILPRDIAARERVNERFVRRLMPLAFLAPAVIEAIVEGRQPPELTGEFLSRGIEIPVQWTKQAAALGFAD
jgi:site-specific DNA recombinase